MKFHGLILAVIVLGALSGFLYWSDHHKSTDKVAQASADISPKLLSLNQDDVSRVDINKKSSDELALEKDSSGKWQVVSPKLLGVDKTAMSNLLSTLTALSSERVIEDNATNPAQYGLTTPVLQVDIAEKHKAVTLLIGDDTPTGGASYAMLSGDRRIFTIPTYSKSNLDKTANDLRDKRLLTLEPDKVSRIELIAKKQDIEFGRNKDDWQILKPKPLRANGYEVGELVRKLTEARMELGTPDDDAKKTMAAFSAGSPVATVKLTDPSGTQELQIRKNKDDYFAKSSVVEGTYKVSSDVGKGADKSLEDFENKKLYDFGFNDPGKIEMHDGSKAYFLTRSGEDWWSNGKKMDPGSVQSLVSNLRDLSASQLVDSGFTAPSIDATVTSNDGKREERVLIAKSGNRYLAQRENETTLYLLESKSVEDLQKSAADVKPAAEKTNK